TVAGVGVPAYFLVHLLVFELRVATGLAYVSRAPLLLVVALEFLAAEEDFALVIGHFRLEAGPIALGRQLRWFGRFLLPILDGFARQLPVLPSLRQRLAVYVVVEAVEVRHPCRLEGFAPRAGRRRRSRKCLPDFFDPSLLLPVLVHQVAEVAALGTRPHAGIGLDQLRGRAERHEQQHDQGRQGRTRL